MFGIKQKIKTALFKIKWRRKNVHNYTSVSSCFDVDNVTVGKKTYGVLNINLGTNSDRKIQIGNYCSIAPNVNFVINPHNYKFFSSWGWQIFEYNERNYSWENKTEIVVEDDVWIGQGATILGGAILHQGCIVGAGTIVAKEIPAYAIYAGNRIIKYRFEPDVCDKLLQIDYDKFDASVTEKIKGWHKIEIDSSNIDKFLSLVPLKEKRD